MRPTPPHGLWNALLRSLDVHPQGVLGQLLDVVVLVAALSARSHAADLSIALLLFLFPPPHAFVLLLLQNPPRNEALRVKGLIHMPNHMYMQSAALSYYTWEGGFGPAGSEGDGDASEEHDDHDEIQHQGTPSGSLMLHKA
eukprot:9470952-Pyramimonas_sp.AAC.1